jgi:hypothetical protein
MKKIAATLLSLTSIGSASAATLDLYVDSATQQIYAEPGPNRVKLGTFVQVDEKTAPQAAAQPAPAAAPAPARTSRLPATASSATTRAWASAVRAWC